jgi:hypothetical protein
LLTRAREAELRTLRPGSPNYEARQ